MPSSVALLLMPDLVLLGRPALGSSFATPPTIRRPRLTGAIRHVEPVRFAAFLPE
ncbi:MAG TPA: hypothetical protein VHX65_01915 [Pirellulales bacterium]|nr:hypothetical protein [Pirellulales bacterium]